MLKWSFVKCKVYGSKNKSNEFGKSWVDNYSVHGPPVPHKQGVEHLEFIKPFIRFPRSDVFAAEDEYG